MTNCTGLDGPAPRLAGTAFGASALSGLTDLVWADRTAIVALAVGAGEAAYRKVFPSAKLLRV
jgi:hypothetical protein